MLQATAAPVGQASDLGSGAGRSHAADPELLTDLISPQGSAGTAPHPAFQQPPQAANYPTQSSALSESALFLAPADPLATPAIAGNTAADPSELTVRFTPGASAAAAESPLSTLQQRELLVRFIAEQEQRSRERLLLQQLQLQQQQFCEQMARQQAHHQQAAAQAGRYPQPMVSPFMREADVKLAGPPAGGEWQQQRDRRQVLIHVPRASLSASVPPWPCPHPLWRTPPLVGMGKL